MPNVEDWKRQLQDRERALAQGQRVTLSQVMPVKKVVTWTTTWASGIWPGYETLARLSVTGSILVEDSVIYDQTLLDADNVRLFTRGTKSNIEEGDPTTNFMSAPKCYIRMKNGRVNGFANHPEVKVEHNGGYQWLICQRCGASVVTN